MSSIRASVRRARPADREAVIRFTEHTYEWGDYIPMVWDRWFSEPGSEMLLGIVDKQPVALLHLVMVTSREAWCEGMRVDVECRRLGIAQRVVGNAISRAAKMGADTIRFITSADNAPVHRMAAYFGFQKVTSVCTYFARGLPPRPGIEKTSVDDLHTVKAFMERSEVLKAMDGLISHHWRFYKLTPNLLEEKLQAGLGRKVGQPGNIEAFALLDDGGGLGVSFIDGNRAALNNLVRGLRGEASGYKRKDIMVHAPADSQLDLLLPKVRMKLWDDEPVRWIYELNIE